MGKLIVLDGLDGSGKATHTKRLYEYLKGKGENVIKVSFPDYDSPASAPVRMYLDGAFGEHADDVNAYAASTFYAVDRYASFKCSWGEKYNSGALVLADRYTSSNAIHQMSKLDCSMWDSYLDWLYDFEFNKLKLPEPDAVIYLDMLPQISQKLIEKRYEGDLSKKDIHERDTEFLQHSRKSALYAAKHLGWQVVKLYEGETPLSKDQNFKRILQAAQQFI